MIYDIHLLVRDADDINATIMFQLEYQMGALRKTMIA
jgi:hypothetical protein